MSSESAPEKPSSRAAAGLTLRVVVLGGILAMFIAVWTPHTNYVMHGPRLTLSHISIAALISFLLVVFCIQIPLRRWRPDRIGCSGSRPARLPSSNPRSARPSP